MGLSKKIFESDIEVLGLLNAVELQINSVAITATSAEINLLDLAGLTAGWVLSADSAISASWKAPVSTALSDLSDVSAAAQTAGFVLASSGGAYAGRALINSDLPATIVVGDHGTGTTDKVVNVCYGTSATPPTASGTTEGALYIQYTP